MKIICFNRKFDHKAIRNRTDIVKLLLQACELINGNQYMILESINDTNNNPFIYIDKMNRMFITEDDQFFSIGFPFNINISDSKVTFLNNSIIINNQIIAVIESLINSFDEKMPIDNLLDILWEEEGFNQASEEEKDSISVLITVLLSYEVGYIRYDYDPENAQKFKTKGIPNVHPINHLDINYSSCEAYKIGLNRKIDMKFFVNLLNVSTDCSFIE